MQMYACVCHRASDLEARRSRRPTSPHLASSLFFPLIIYLSSLSFSFLHHYASRVSPLPYFYHRRPSLRETHDVHLSSSQLHSSHHLQRQHRQLALHFSATFILLLPKVPSPRAPYI